MNDPLALIDRLALRWLNWRRDREIDKADDPDMEIMKVEMKGPHLDIMATHPAFGLLIADGAAMLNEANAENYIQFDMLPKLGKPLKPIRVTIQWMHGMSPAEKNAKLDRENATLRVRIADLEAERKAKEAQS